MAKVSGGDTSPLENQLLHANEILYQHSRELAVKNKTLALFDQLYEISTLSLDQTTMAKRMTEEMRKELELEYVGICSFDVAKDTLSLIGSILSDRLRALQDDTFVGEIVPESLLYTVAHTQKSNYSEHFSAVCRGLMSDALCDTAERESFVRSSLVFPLVSNGQTCGVLFVGLSRVFGEMPDYERRAVESCVDVVAIALYKVQLYEQLKETNARLVELDRLKNEFLSLASHQMRAPLTSIKGFASLLLEGDLGEITPKVREAIEKIFASANLMVRSVEDFLNVSRIEQGQMKYDFAQDDIGTLAGEMVKRFKPVADQKKIALVFEPRVSGLTVSMDTYKLEQVLTNLIDNAIKYTLEGSVTVIAERHDQMARIVVKDSGVGMSPEAIGKLFQRFARAEGAGKVNVAGTGLGLYVARQMIEAHGGKIWAESEGENKGSSFIIELPIMTAA